MGDLLDPTERWKIGPTWKPRRAVLRERENGQLGVAICFWLEECDLTIPGQDVKLETIAEP
jgi:hypothetical protein